MVSASSDSTKPPYEVPPPALPLGRSIESFGVPSGVIVMWSGAEQDIPDGWALCDGSQGTPDLRDRFIVSAGSDHSIGDTGGSNEIILDSDNLPSHSHSGSSESTGSHSHGSGSYGTGTVSDHSHGSGTYDTTTDGVHDHSHDLSTGSDGSHTHTGDTRQTDLDNHTHLSTSTFASGVTSGDMGGGDSDTISTNSAGSHSHDISGSIDNAGGHFHDVSGWSSDAGGHDHSVSGTSSSAGDHSHDLNIDSTGDNAPFSIKPSYYALAFIMRL